jgi:tetratricopeptide (TPR) repeat protein
MKRLLISVLLLLIAGIIGVAVYSVLFKSDEAASMATADWETLSETNRKEAFTDLMSSPIAPQDSRNAIKWMFLNHPEEATTLLNDAIDFSGRFPKDLSDVALELIREENFSTGMKVLEITRKLFPSDPHVLGMIGIIAYLTNRHDEARKYLEWARTWQRDIPLVDFYLGGLLIQSESTVDRTRGKTLLKGVISAQSPDLKELAGLALLSNRAVPVLKSEFVEILEVLKGLNTFRPDNPNLNALVMRILVNRANELAPGEALPLAMVLIKFPDSTEEDQLATAELAQMQMDIATAGELLNPFQPEDMEEDNPFITRVRRLKAIQLLMERNFSEGVEMFRRLVSEMPDSPGLTSSFRVALTADMPLEYLREMLALYLRLDISDPAMSTSVLTKLIEVDPLRQEEWGQYAAENLLSQKPGPIGNWLIRNGFPEKVIDTFSTDLSTLTASESVVLIEAAFAVDNLDLAEAAIAAGRARLDPSMYEFMRARLALENDDLEEAFEHWKAAHNSAIMSQSFPLLQNLGFLALELDQPVTALQSLYTAFSAGISFSQMQAGRLLELTLKYGSLPQSIKVAEFLAERYPDNPVHKNNLAYFRFLAEQDLEQSVETMRELVEANPNVHNYRLTLALGLLKIGRQNEANRLLQSTPINWESTGNRGQLIYAAVLSANNQRVVADGLIQNIDLESLIPEEKALIEAL